MPESLERPVMKVFVVNCGSSSIKYQLFDMTNESVLAKGLLERVGGAASLHHSGIRGKVDRDAQAPDHRTGLGLILAVLVDEKFGVIRSIV